MDNCPTILIYRKHRVGDEIIYYVLFTCTKRSFRGQGYGSKVLDGLVERAKEENKSLENESKRKVKIVLSSLETAVLFYEEYGFRWTKESILKHPVLVKHESYSPKKEYYIMELLVF
jgi:ribosomal protein S18 acetylase RimI-like enzyme